MIYLYFVILLLLFFITFFACKKNIISPAVIFTFGFLFQSVWAVLYKNKWELNLHLNTFIVLLIGIITFIITCFVINNLFSKKKSKGTSSIIDYIEIDKWKKICFLAFSVIVGFIYLKFVVNSAGGKLSNISKIPKYISEFDRLSKFSNSHIRIPFLIGNCRTAIIAAGYWFIFVTLNNYMKTKKIDFLNLTIIITVSIISVLNGSRTPVFFIIAAGATYAFILQNAYNKNKSSLNSKLFIKIGIIGISFLCLFTTFAKVLGRDIKTNSADYLAIYCGAEVKNLDLFMQDNLKTNDKYFGTQTFRPIITTIGKKIGFKGYEDYKLDLPFRSVGKYNLGNVYTTFYPYMYDFSYIGLIILVIIMAVISQIVYECAIRPRDKKTPSIWSISYGVISACLLLSFFSNKFYENIITMEFLKQLIVWYLCTLFFCKLDLNNLRKKFKAQQVK